MDRPEAFAGVRLLVLEGGIPGGLLRVWRGQLCLPGK